MSIVNGMGPGPQTSEPIGLQVTRTAKALSRAFDKSLVEVGGSLAVWLVLVELQGRVHGRQRELAEAVGVEGPTLTHHLNRMEAAGLVTRRRDPENRRVHRVELTDDGRAVFFRLLDTVVAFDERLRAGFNDAELAALRDFLERLVVNITNVPDSPTPDIPDAPESEAAP
jgi:MarR family transcriptional regulator, transcriptional regulator for hemolysin